MAVRAAATDKGSWTHHISLSDGVTTIGLMAVGPDQAPNILAIRRVPYPKGTLVMGSASGALSERRQPYGEFSRSEWIGGMGLLQGEADSTRYYFGERVWTLSPGKVLLGPMQFWSAPEPSTYPWPLQNHNEMQAVDVAKALSTVSLTGANLYYATKFTANGTQTVQGVTVMLEVRGNPGAVTAAIYADTAGSPGGAAVVSGTIDVTDYVIGRERYYIPFGTPAALTGAADYWLVFTVASPTASAWVKVTTYTNIYTQKKSVDGSTWLASTDEPPLFHIVPNIDWEDIQFFRYLNCLYCAVRIGREDARTADTSLIFYNGGRGLASAGGAATLTDSTQSWATNRWAGAVVRIIAGTGAGQWRVIASNTGTVLTVSPAWVTNPAAASEYVIANAPSWAQRALTLTTWVRDVAVSDQNVVYLAQGQDVYMQRYRESNSGGTWTVEPAEADGTNKADLLLAGYDQAVGNVIWRAQNTTSSRTVSKATAAAWDTDLTFGSDIKIGGQDEKITDLVEYDGKIAVLQTGSIWMVLNDVPDKLSIDLNLRNLTNGRRARVMTPYLALPYGNRLERLYNSLLEDFGPEKDDGLPAGYTGVTADIEDIPGGLVIVKDGSQEGVNASWADKVSGVYVYRGGWHPVATLPYRAQGRGLWIEASEDRRDRLWIGHRRGINYLQWPREWDYRDDANYDADANVSLDGYLVTGWYNAGNEVIEKIWRKITLHAKLPTGCSVEVWYQTEDNTWSETDRINLQSGWTRAGEATSTSTYMHEITVGATSVRIRFLLRLVGSGSATPELNGYNVSWLGRIEASHAYQVQFRASDAGFGRDGVLESGQDVATLIAKLDEWAADPITILTMRCVFDPYDNHEVVIEPASLQPAWLDETGEGQMCSIQILEV